MLSSFAPRLALPALSRANAAASLALSRAAPEASDALSRALDATSRASSAAALAVSAADSAVSWLCPRFVCNRGGRWRSEVPAVAELFACWRT